MIFLGIDPGINGAACAFMCAELHDEAAFVSDTIDLPTMPDGKNLEIDPHAIRGWVLSLPEKPTRAFIENVTPMPSIPDHLGDRRSMGSASAFRFGGAVYAVRTCLRMMDIRVQLTHAAIWKAHFSLRGADKEDSRQLALRLHPEAAHMLQRKMDHQRAEAILIARHAAELRGLAPKGEAL